MAFMDSIKKAFKNLLSSDEALNTMLGISWAETVDISNVDHVVTGGSFARRMYVPSAGNIKVDLVDSSAVVLTFSSACFVDSFWITKVYKTGTTVVGTIKVFG
jgi:hypothetical protein